MGNALEFYDFTVYAAFAAMIGRAFFPATDPKISLLLSVATFGVGFFARPLGGILIGAYADRFGRKPAMTLTIWLMALGSGAIGLLPTYDQIGLFAPVLLVLARLVQGFSAGGEMGPATTYLLESAPPGWTCFFGSWQLASQNIGNLISGVIGVILALLMSEADVNGWGWRIPFLLGILIAPVGFYIRRNLDETLHAEEALGSMSEVLSDVLGMYWRKIVLCILAISGATVTQYFFIYATTYAITTLGYSPAGGDDGEYDDRRGGHCVRAARRRAGGPVRGEGDRGDSATGGDGAAVPGAATDRVLRRAWHADRSDGCADGAACNGERGGDHPRPEDLSGGSAHLRPVDRVRLGRDDLRRDGAGGVHLDHRRDRG
jgi:hypothetical protein